MTSKYVLGFFFTPEGFILIFNTKEGWQQGLWNGIGGTVEDGESELEAMTREFLEETGIATSPNSWDKVCRIYGENEKGKSYELVVWESWWPFRMEYDPHITDEGVASLVTKGMAEPMDETARWLLSFCIDKRQSKLRVDFP